MYDWFAWFVTSNDFTMYSSTKYPCVEQWKVGKLEKEMIEFGDKEKAYQIQVRDVEAREQALSAREQSLNSLDADLQVPTTVLCMSVMNQ
jgi:hypothetical protein